MPDYMRAANILLEKITGYSISVCAFSKVNAYLLSLFIKRSNQVPFPISIY